MHPAGLCRHHRRCLCQSEAAHDTHGSFARCCLRALLLPGLIACSLLLLSAACRTSQLSSPVDLTQPGWNLRHGQAIWHLPNSDTEFAGELTSATHPNGTILLEFTKTPMTLVVARLDAQSWELNFVADNRNYRGRGQPPSRSAWLVLALALAERPLPAEWNWSGSDSGDWQLTSPKTGEQLRGYWQP
jgi:hypothetical protein